MAVKTSQNMRAGLAAVGYIVKPTADAIPATAPSISTGTGAPTATAPNGSLYLRVDATDGNDVVYARITGSWVALKGHT